MSLLRFLSVAFWLVLWYFLVYSTIALALLWRLNCLILFWVIDVSVKVLVCLTWAERACKRCGLLGPILLARNPESSYGRCELGLIVSRAVEPPAAEGRAVSDPFCYSYCTDSIPAIMRPANFFCKNGLSLRLRILTSFLALTRMLWAWLLRWPFFWVTKGD